MLVHLSARRSSDRRWGGSDLRKSPTSLLCHDSSEPSGFSSIVLFLVLALEWKDLFVEIGVGGLVDLLVGYGPSGLFGYP